MMTETKLFKGRMLLCCVSYCKVVCKTGSPRSSDYEIRDRSVTTRLSTHVI